jgi:Flp pilus assembly protein TadG
MTFVYRPRYVKMQLKKTVLFHKFWKSDDGAGMVEFAIAGAVLSFVLLGIIEFGLAAWQKNSVAADVREGARYAIVRGTTSGRTTTVDSVAKYVKTRTSLDTAGLRVYATWSPDKRPGGVVTIRVAHNVPRRGPFIPAHTDSANSRMVIVF